MHSAAILAGGRSSRFGGQDKGALVVDGRTIRERQIAAMSSVVTEILIVGGREAAVCPIRAVPDLLPGCGPLGGVHTALTEARGDAVFVVACDMPYLDARFIAYLLDLTRDADAVVPRYHVRGARTPDPTDSARYHPLCAAYTRACLDPIARRLADRRLTMTDLLADVRTRVVGAEELERFGDAHRLLANVNTAAEYAGIQGHEL